MSNSYNVKLKGRPNYKITGYANGLQSVENLNTVTITNSDLLTTGRLNVGTGGTVITTTSSGLVGINNVNPTATLDVVGNVKVSGIITATTFSGNATNSNYALLAGIATYAVLAGVSTNVSGGTGSLTQLNVSGITTTGSLSIGSTQVISSSRQLQNIASLDAVTTATIESAITNAPNTFTDLQVTGITTLNSVNSGNINSSGIITASSFVPSSGFIKAPDGTNSLYIYSGTGNVAFQGTIGASQVNSASGYKALDFGTTTTPSVNITNSLNVGAGVSVVGVVTASSFSGNASSATYASTAGIATYATSSGISTYATSAGVSTNVIGGTGSLTQLNVSGITTTGTLNVGTGGTVITTTSSGLVGVGNTNPTESLDVVGNIKASGTVTANSDRSLKENIRTIPDALKKVLLLRGVEYDRIDNGDHQIGVIAQEVEEIVPEVVYGDEIKSVAYANLVGLLIEAIKELENEIKELKK